MKWTDGSIYQGEWARGIQHGQGKMMFPGGNVKEGYFELNVFKGPCKSPLLFINSNAIVSND